MNPKINTRRKWKIKKLHNFTCVECGQVKPSQDLEIDHRIPTSAGGTNDLGNLIPLCIECHLKKTKEEWRNGTFFQETQIESSSLTPQEKLKEVKDFITANRNNSYNEVQFMVLNHPLLSKFEYNTNILSNLYLEIKGIKKQTPINNRQYLDQRNFMLNFVKEKLDLSYRGVESLLKEGGFDMSFRQIATICAKFGKNLEKEGKNSINSSKNDDL